MQNNQSSPKAFPKKPLIRKLGTISCNNIVETTPLVFKGELYRFEVIRRKSFTSEKAIENWREIDDLPCLRFVHVRTNTAIPYFAEGHTFGFAYAENDTMYVVTGSREYWGSDGLVFYRSNDLVNWEQYATVDLPGWKIYNMNIAKMGDVYTLLIEIGEPEEECGVPYTFRFMQSTDLTNWTMTPSDCVFQKDRYCGSPAIYTFDGDPYYYVGYLEAYPNYGFADDSKTPNYCFASCVARSVDLKKWEYSPINPVLMYNDEEDKKIGNPFLTPTDRKRIDEALNINNSDMEMCEYLGRTIIYYSWGNQRGTEFLAEACYEGGMHEFLKSFFEA